MIFLRNPTDNSLSFGDYQNFTVGDTKMKTKMCKLLIASLFAVLVASLGPSLASAQDEKAAADQLQMPKPPKAHAVLKKEVGEW